MPSFFDNFGKKIGEAAQAAAKKSGELVEITKINLNINSEEEKIRKIYQQIGRKVYENYKADGIIADEFKEACDEITTHEGIITELRQKIDSVKSIKSCTSCGAQIDKAVVYCNKCGTKQEEIEEVEVVVEQPATKMCPSCNMQVSPDSYFCNSCGEKLG